VEGLVALVDGKQVSHKFARHLLSGDRSYREQPAGAPGRCLARETVPPVCGDRAQTAIEPDTSQRLIRVPGLNPGARERATGDNRKGENRVCHEFLLPAHVSSLPGYTGRGPWPMGNVSSDFG
jgi:hypothetical protein